jgi:hypothetical protein
MDNTHTPQVQVQPQTPTLVKYVTWRKGDERMDRSLPADKIKYYSEQEFVDNANHAWTTALGIWPDHDVRDFNSRNKRDAMNDKLVGRELLGQNVGNPFLAGHQYVDDINNFSMPQNTGDQ